MDPSGTGKRDKRFPKDSYSLESGMESGTQDKPEEIRLLITSSLLEDTGIKDFKKEGIKRVYLDICSMITRVKMSKTSCKNFWPAMEVMHVGLYIIIRYTCGVIQTIFFCFKTKNPKRLTLFLLSIYSLLLTLNRSNESCFKS